VTTTILSLIHPALEKVTDAPKRLSASFGEYSTEIVGEKSSPDPSGCAPPTLDHRLQFARPMLLMDPAAEAAIGRGKVVIAVDEARTERFATRSE
jgi:hypothetical protein